MKHAWCLHKSEINTDQVDSWGENRKLLVRYRFHSIPAIRTSSTLVSFLLQGRVSRILNLGGWKNCRTVATCAPNNLFKPIETPIKYQLIPPAWNSSFAPANKWANFTFLGERRKVCGKIGC